MAVIGIIVTGSALWAPPSTYGWGGTLSTSWNSIHCKDQINGGTRQNANDGAASCTINIKEIATVCRNPAGNADHSTSHIFAIQPTSIQEAQSGSAFLLQKNGQFLSDIFFSAEEIQAALGSQFPTLDPAVLCPNKNWKLVWAVSRFDMVATVNNVVNGWKPFFVNPTSTGAFATCNPATSSLKT